MAIFQKKHKKFILKLFNEIYEPKMSHNKANRTMTQQSNSHH